VTHNPAEILSGHEPRRGGPAQHHLTVSPAANFAGAQAGYAWLKR